MPRSRPQKIQVYHVTAPTCFWSWGYEAVFNRLRMVYGDQVDVHVLTSCVYDDFEEYLKHYEMTFGELVDWTKEGMGIMGVPLATELRRETFPRSVMPATLAVMAAYRQGTEKGARFNRAILRRWNVELQDVTKEDTLVAVAQETGLNVAKFRRDCADKAGLQKDLEHQAHDFPHLPLGFYNVVISDGDSRTVILDHAFKPAAVEDAIDWLSGGRLKKTVPKDVGAYLQRHGPAPLVEIARVFGLPPDKGKRELTALEKKGKAQRLSLAGAPHWQAA